MSDTTDAIAVLEKMLDAARLAIKYKLDPPKKSFLEKEIPALTLAIERLKSKSDAEVILEWLSTGKPGDFDAGDYALQKVSTGIAVMHVSEFRKNLVGKTDSYIEAPTLSELAAKLKEKT